MVDDMRMFLVFALLVFGAVACDDDPAPADCVDLAAEVSAVDAPEKVTP